MRIRDGSSDLCSSYLYNLGIELAAERDCDWLFMMQVRDLMNVSAFQHLENFRGNLDAVWGNICVNEIGRSEARRVGKAGVSTCRSRWYPNQLTQNITTTSCSYDLIGKHYTYNK